MHKKCPKQEALFEFVSIPTEMSAASRLMMRLHTGRCAKCQQQMQAIRLTWEDYFKPAPDISDSLARVYSRLQADETLILKGWKLTEFRPVRLLRANPVVGWASAGGMALAAMLLLIFGLPFHNETQEPVTASLSSEKLPFAQIRVEDKDNNRVQVHYVQPELLQSIEFETTSAQ